MEVFVNLNRISAFGNIGFHRADVVITVIGHYIVRGDKCRYVTSCFFGQIIINTPIVGFSSRAADGFVDSARSQL